MERIIFLQSEAHIFHIIHVSEEQENNVTELKKKYSRKS